LTDFCKELTGIQQIQVGAYSRFWIFLYFINIAS
jgi:inhibitor of KinA sporulation pathway (predicted exonuclease)